MRPPPPPESSDYLVIGSGPAAVAATHALVSQGHHVTILDVGTRLDPNQQVIVDRMSAQDPTAWASDDVAAISGRKSSVNEAVHSKLSYGSSYSFDTRSDALQIHWQGVHGFHHSLAKGGLSNVWGSSLLPYRQEDIEDWPIRIEDLHEHYRAIMEFVPCTSVRDDLEEILPSYSAQNAPLEPSRQGRALLNDLEASRMSLRSSGIFFGRSRLAINARGDDSKRPCTYCTLCLSGCPYGLIYSSTQTIDEWINEGKVSYFPDHLVENLHQDVDHVVVSGRNIAEDRPFTIRANRVFLSAGVLPTAKIILHSLRAYDHSITFRDSQYFIYPLLRFGLTGGVEYERMHTSSQAYLEIDDPAISTNLVHLQIYGYSSFLRDELMRTFLRWPLRIPAFRRHFLGRLLIVQGFIHSNESSSIALTLEKSNKDTTILHARIPKPRKALATVLKVGWKLLMQTAKLRAIPLLPGLQFPNPGSGYHSGGTFPMRTTPGPFETDTLGRLPSMDRVHIVDSSVLPSIPATSITFSAMANAHRIATHAGKLVTT